MNRRVLAIAAATVIALVGALMVFVYARNADNRAVAAQEAKKVYVSTAVIPAGTSLRDAQPRPPPGDPGRRQGLPRRCPREVDAVNYDDVALADVNPGQYVLAAAFGTEKIQTKTITVPPGMLAMAVSLSDPARVGNFVTPGSHITIFQSYVLKSFETDEKSKQFNSLSVKGTSVLLADVQVIGVGNTTTSARSSRRPRRTPASSRPRAAGASFLVTLAIKPEDAVKLVHAINAPYTLYGGLLGESTKVPATLAIDDRTYLKGATK